MSEPWDDIVTSLRLKRESGDEAFQVALVAIEQIAGIIADGPLGSALFGWTSMHDLCVQQSDVPPYSGPYLRISPLPSGSVEFRYIDTAIVHRQWQRLEPANQALGRLKMFLDQLGWVTSNPDAINGFRA